MSASTVAPFALSIPDAAKALGVGRSTLYGLVRHGELRSVHIGDRHLVPAGELAAYVARLVAKEHPDDKRCPGTGPPGITDSSAGTRGPGQFTPPVEAGEGDVVRRGPVSEVCEVRSLPRRAQNAVEHAAARSSR